MPVLDVMAGSNIPQNFGPETPKELWMVPLLDSNSHNPLEFLKLNWTHPNILWHSSWQNNDEGLIGVTLLMTKPVFAAFSSKQVPANGAILKMKILLRLSKLLLYFQNLLLYLEFTNLALSWYNLFIQMNKKLLLHILSQLWNAFNYSDFVQNQFETDIEMILLMLNSKTNTYLAVWLV